MKLLYKPLAAAVAVTTLLSGCMVGPNYKQPQITVPAHFKELDGWTEAHPDADAAPKGDWWTVFHDPLMDQLEPQVVVSNQTVRQDYANYQQALAELKVANGSLFPTLDISSDATRAHASSNSKANSSGTLEATASWELDVWGKVRRQIEENRANAQASAATLANATLSEQLALATAIINLRASDANIDLLQHTVKEYQEYLRVVNNQTQAGIVAPSNLMTARTQLENAQANLISLGAARAQYEHAIAVLVGKNPSDLTVPHSNTMPDLPAVPAVLPSALLERRPDIAIAERQVAAQNAAIGVAVAAYYPTISLSALDGFSHSPISGLISAANNIWSLGASAGATLFDGGQRRGTVSAAQAAYDAAVANYRGTVLAAFQSVENQLSNLRILGQQASVLNSAVNDATQGAKIAFNEYQAGTVDYTTVATALSTQLNTQQSALSVHTQRLLDSATLISDLGGGWTTPQNGK